MLSIEYRKTNWNDYANKDTIFPTFVKSELLKEQILKEFEIKYTHIINLYMFKYTQQSLPVFASLFSIGMPKLVTLFI